MKLKFFITVCSLLCSQVLLFAQIGSRMTAFRPADHGLKFRNTLEVEVINDVRMSGFCGGMVYTALDYYRARKPVPEQSYTPANGTPLYDYMWGRQRSSVLDNLDKWTELFVNPFGWRTDEFFNWGLQGYGGGRLQELKEEIDKGNPVPLGLFKPGGGGTGPHHQVLAIGYNGGRYRGDLGNYKEDLEISVYDPNYPGEIKVLKPDPVNKIYFYKDNPGNSRNHWQTYFVNKKYNFSTPPTIANAPASADGLVRQVLLEIRTGNDDLRGGNDNVSVTIHFKTKPSQTFTNINKGARWINNYTETVPINLATAVPEGEFKSISFKTSFGGGISGDNWNMDMVRVLCNGKELLSKAGSPLYRFTGQAQTFTLSFPSNLLLTKTGITVAPDYKVRELLLEFGTGNDDLRGGNDNVNVTLYYKDGTSQVFSNINKSNSWGGGSTKFVTLQLKKYVPVDQLKSIVLKTTFGGGIGGDNWNLDYLVVTAKGNGVNKEIYVKEGSPLIRFDGNNKPFTAEF